jgi:hypothetical protein
VSPDDLKQQKEVELYAAEMAAWFNTSLERDKSIFALSAGGIGLLLTLLTTIGLNNVVLLVLYIAAVLAFLVSLVAVVAIFRHNQVHIERVSQGHYALDPVLTLLDQVAISAFGIGAVLAAVIAIATAVISYSERENSMSEEQKPRVPRTQLDRSFNGLGNLHQPGSDSATAPASPRTTTDAPAAPTTQPSSIPPPTVPTTSEAK